MLRPILGNRLKGVTLLTGGGYDPVIALGDDLYEEWWAGAGITLSSGKVASWAGRKESFLLSQAVPSFQPGFSATGLNGLPAVSPDGLDDSLELIPAPGTFPSVDTPGEMWVLMTQPLASSEASSRTIAAYGNVANVSRRLLRYSSGVKNLARLQVGIGSGNVTTANTTLDFDGTAVVRGITEATQIKVRVNGEPDPSPSAAVAATVLLRLRFFATAASVPAEFGVGDFSRVLFTKPLSSQKATALLAFLMTQGGVT